MTSLYIVRHCEAEGNIKRFFQGYTDGAASENGAVQCDALAERFKSIRLDAIYSSPLSRTVFTASAVNRYHNLPIRTDAELIEINGGHWEGELWARLPAKYPGEADAWESHPWDFAPKGGESMRHVYDRIFNAVSGIASRHEGKTVAVFSHGCAIKNLLTRVIHNDITQFLNVSWCDNTGVSLIEWEGGVPRVVFQNDSSHLDDSISTLNKQKWWREGAESRFE